MTEQAQAVVPVVLSIGAWIGWLSLILAVTALAGWAVAEATKRILAVVETWSKLKRTVVLVGISTLVGVVAGVILGWRLPIDDPWIGGLVGLCGGASPGWVVRLLKKRGAKVSQ